MSRQKQQTYSGNKPTHNFLCCPCFRSKGPPRNPSITALFEKNEPYEYVVEKLAIKKVPLRLFATTEDMQIASKVITVAPSSVSQKSGQLLPVTAPLHEKKSSVTFSPRYTVVQQPENEHMSHISALQHEALATTPASESENEMAFSTSQQQQQQPNKVPMTQDVETELVSRILNTHSSLYTLDSKSAVPKDPDRPLPSTVVIPPNVQAALNRQQGMQRKQISADVHKVSTSPKRYPVSMPSVKKEIPPALQLTINALGLAQKPHIRGLPPKNQKSLSGSITDTSENEISHRMLVPDKITQQMPSQKQGCQILQTADRVSCKRKLNSQRGVAQHTYVESEHDELKGGKMYRGVDNTALPFDTQLARSLIAQGIRVEANDGSGVPLSNKCSEIEILPAHGALCSEPELQNSEQLSEISQLRGQRLKWKIIIKHHANKNSEGRTSSIRSEDSETSSVNMYCTLANRNSSPNR